MLPVLKNSELISMKPYHWHFVGLAGIWAWFGCGCISQDSKLPVKQANINSFKISWHRGFLTGVNSEELKFIDLDSSKKSAARNIPPLTPTNIQWPRDTKKLWLGAYCHNEADFALFVEAVLAIRGEFGHDPPSVGYKFPGEAFFFLTSKEISNN